MLRRPMMWFALSLLCMAGAWFFWKWGDAAVARRRQAAPPVPASSRAVRAESTTVTARSTAIPLLSAATAQRSATNLSPLALRLTNSARPYRELVRDGHALLLENAVIDTAQSTPLVIPPHLRALREPGAYLVQSRRELDDSFRATLKAAGATIVSYIPNNAYLVRASATAAARLAADPQTQAVQPYEPYYKVRSTLLPLAVRQAMLPENALLNLVLFADAAAATRAAVQGLGAQVLAEDHTPFGPLLRIKPTPDSLLALAGLPGVQLIEPAAERVRANDLSRVRIGVATNTLISTSNYLGLTGANILVGVTDEGVDAGFVDLAGKVLGDIPGSLRDTSGHGTHVATTIAGSGAASLSVTSPPPGSVTNADFRGRAPGARIFSTLYTGTNAPNAPFLSDGYLQETVSRTNVFISNNSWGYGNDNTYSISAASYDASVRDAQPGVTGAQPLVLVFAAGNGGAGPDSGLGGDAGSVVAPGTGKNVITVGALEQLRDITNSFISNCITNTDGTNLVVICDTNRPFGNATDSDTQIASYSSRGNVGIGTEGDFGRYKPDVVAPGTMVVSGRSRQWDETAYYDPISITANNLVNVTLDPGSNFLNQIFIPDNAVRVVIRLFPNAASPTPFPRTPIFVRQSGPPSAASPVATNVFTLPGDLALDPVGTTWYYRIVNVYTQQLSFDIITTIATVNEDNGAKTILRTLNDAVGPNYRFESGTSMAAAEVSGTLALMQQFFEQILNVKVSPALLKASLINGARPAGPAYDFQVDNTINYQGWGAINLENSLPPGVTNGVPRTGVTRGKASVQLFDQNPATALATGQSQTREFHLAPDASQLPLKVTLVWTDPPGNPAAATKLVNDLDLVVTNLDTGQAYFGNRFLPGSNFTAPLDTNEVATADIINNVENVFIAPDLGTNYSVTVRARRVNVNAVTDHPNDTVQDYALIVSCGSGEVPEALELKPETPILGSLTPEITLVTNTFTSREASGFLLGNQHVGANTPLLGTTNGITNQWHFYIVTNTTDFTNAAFVTFLPPTLSVPRMGTRERDVDNATRVEADIDLYVSTSPALLNLDPAALDAARKSVGRGGTEQVILSNSFSGAIYYIGVKAEDQMAAEYAFFGVFSLLPFDSADGTVRCFPTPTLIPDRSPATLTRVSDAALVICPCALEGQTRRVVVTNTITHENFGDLVGNLAHNTKFAVVNNHRPAPISPVSPGPYNFIYEDNQEYLPPVANYYQLGSDGPGSLRDFVGEERLGPWIFTYIDDSLTQTGLVNQVSLLVEKQDVNGTNDRFLAPNSFIFDFVDVPADATNLSVCVAGNSTLVELYVRRGSFPTRNAYDHFTTIPAGGGCLNITPQDLPPLAVGRYYIGVYNPSAVGQNVRLVATVTRAPGLDNSLKFVSGDEIPILDDGVTYASIFNPNFGQVGDVKVGLRIDHPRISDLAITLISPRGTRVLLSENRGWTNAFGFGSSFSVTNVVPVSSAGGPAANTNVIDTGTTEGFITVDYDFYEIKDRLTAYYDGALIFDSGLVGGSGRFKINYGPGFGTSVMLVMNEGGNPNLSTQWKYVASSVSSGHNYVIFTEDTELTTTPIKYGQPPFVPSGVATNYLLSGFDGATIGSYAPGQVVDGWNVLTNGPGSRVEVINDPALVNVAPNSLAMHNGWLQRSLPTRKGKTYGLSYAYRRNSLFDGLVSWWPAEDNYDDVADGNNGVGGGNVTFTNGLVGKAFLFDGDRDGVIVGTNANLQLQDFTIETWIKRSSPTTLSFNGNGNATIFANGTGTLGGPGGYGFYVRNDNRLALGKSQANEVVGTAVLSDTNWHHIAVTKVGTNVVFYTDGVAFPAPAYDSGGFTFAAPAVIGAWWNPSGLLDNTFFGAIDELSVYNRALSQTEIGMIFAAGSAGKCVPSLPPVVRPSNSAAIGFSTNSNPSGVWSYGFTTNLATSFIRYPETGIAGGVFQYWNTNIWLGAPSVFYNPSGLPATNATYTLGARQLALHPGPNGEYSVIRYTCPTNDQYRLVATFGGADMVGPTTTDVHVLRNGVPIFDGLVYAFGPGPTFSTNLNLVGGELIDFVVGYGTNKDFTWDSTTLSAVIVPTTGCETSPTFVAVGGQTNQLRGTPLWNTNALVFIATSNSTPIDVFSPAGESDVLLDTFVITEPPDGLYFLPEESLKAFEGEIAYGDWRLEIIDTRTGAAVPQPKLLSWQLDFLYQEVLPVPGKIPSGECNTANVPAGGIRYYSIDVPWFVRAVTNRLTFASAPVNVLFNQTIPPTGTNSLPPDYVLLTNAISGTYTLTTNTAVAPILVPGQRYYLGVQNPGTNAVSFTLCIDFDLDKLPPFVTLTNGLPYCTVNAGPSNPIDYYKFVVSSNSVRAQFELTALSDDLLLLLRKGLPPTFSVLDYFSANPYTNDEVITVFDFSKPVPLTPGDWYFAAANLTANPVSYCATATEWPVYGTNIVIVNTFAQSNSVCLTWTSLPGVPYHLEGKTSVDATNWFIASPTIRATGPLTTYCLPLPSPYHYFRVAEGIVINPYVPPPKFASITHVAAGYQLLWNGPTNQLYEVQWTTNIAPSTWLPFAPPVSSSNGRFGFLDDGSQTGGLSGQRYYRLRLWP